MTYPKVSIIVLNYNGKKYLKNCLDSLRKQVYPNYEVIMFDNASTDGSVNYVRENFHWVKIIENPTNLGYAKANNEAEKAASGEYLLFLNVDTWVKPDLLNALISTVMNNPKIGACACTQFSYDGKQRLNSGLTTDLFAYPINPNKKEQILYSDGASLFVKRQVFRRIGGFDPAYFMYGEDVDLCWRILLSGYDVVAAQSAIVGHKTSGTYVKPGKIYQINQLRRYLAERNSLRTILKNYSAHTLLYILPLRAVITLLQIAFFSLIRQYAFVILEIRAIIWNLRKLKDTFALRCVVQQTRRISDRMVMRGMSKLLGLARSFTEIRQGSLG
ncbi:MAG: glycosyltransferase family 2 protein [Candidatus Bathyarchaeia archaeon]